MRLMLGDCLELMRGLPDASVDAVLADPPYGTTACKWDAVIPFAPLWEQLRRVAKPNAAIVLFAAQPFTSALVMSNPDWFKYCWVWSKNIPTDFLNARNKPLRLHEDIAVFSGGTTANGSPRRMTYNPQPREGRGYSVSSPNDRRVGVVAAGNRKPFAPRRVENDGAYYPVSLLPFPADRSRSYPHPTKKPVDLLAYLVRTYTNPGDTVLDFCMGSGTTGVAALQEGRDFIGIEREASYFAIAERRIAAAQPPLFAAAD